MRGRIPNYIKKQAEEEVKKYGWGMAYHYACYGTMWSNPSSYNLRLISAIRKIVKLKDEV